MMLTLDNLTTSENDLIVELYRLAAEREAEPEWYDGMDTASTVPMPGRYVKVDGLVVPVARMRLDISHPTYAYRYDGSRHLMPGGQEWDVSFDVSPTTCPPPIIHQLRSLFRGNKLVVPIELIDGHQHYAGEGYIRNYGQDAVGMWEFVIQGHGPMRKASVPASPGRTISPSVMTIQPGNSNLSIVYNGPPLTTSSVKNGAPNGVSHINFNTPFNLSDLEAAHHAFMETVADQIKEEYIKQTLATEREFLNGTGVGQPLGILNDGGFRQVETKLTTLKLTREDLIGFGINPLTVIGTPKSFADMVEEFQARCVVDDD